MVAGSRGRQRVDLVGVIAKRVKRLHHLSRAMDCSAMSLFAIQELCISELI